MPLNPGARVGPYEILGLAGVGGMGEVYRAHDPRIGRDVAIKILPAAFATDPDRLRRFEQETRATGLLNHPNVLSIYDTGTLDPHAHGSAAPFIVTELLDGHTLRDELERTPPGWRAMLDYAIQIARGLSAAHAKGIIHRDLKPENLFVGKDGRITILDFGIAKLTPLDPAAGMTSAAPTSTAEGVLVGTADYMSPEQARGEPVDHRSDLFALGVILYEMSAGERPFKGRTAADRVSALLRDDPPPLPKERSAVPPGMEGVLRRCLEKLPERRFQSAGDLAFALEAIAGGTAGAPPAHDAGRRGRGAGLATVAVAVTLVAVSGWAWLTRDRDQFPVGRALSAPRVTPFLASGAIEAHPAWSPAGNLIAYVSDAAGNADVWVCDRSGSNPINLTGEFDGTDSVPAWSPDGQRIAFYSDRDGGGIYSMNALGGDVRRVVAIKPGILYTFSLNWAPASALIFTKFDDRGVKQVYRVAADGASIDCLTCDVTMAEGGRDGALSPSGQFLAFKSSEIGPRGAMFVKDLRSGRVTRVGDQADMPRWSPDGRRLLFISARDGTPDIWQVGIDPVSGAAVGEPDRMTSGLGVDAFSLAPDGRQILAVTQKSQGSVWAFPGGADGHDSTDAGRRWTSGQFMDTRPRWMPDGAGVVFQSNRRGSLDIWALASPGTAPARLTSGAGTEHRPRVSPDGQWIAYDQIDSAGEHVHVMRRDGSGARMPADDWRQRFSMTCCSAWSPDGSRLAIHVNASATAVVEIDRRTGAAQQTTVLDLPGTGDQYHRWSPDGRLIAYEAVTDGSWDLWVVNADGSAPYRLTTLPGSERSAAWHPRLPFIYYEDTHGEIWRIPIAASGRPTGAPQRWLTLPGRLTVGGDGIDFDRTGDTVLVSVIESASDIWLVEFAESRSGAARK